MHLTFVFSDPPHLSYMSLQTTTIGMLTGMIPVTSGAAFVAGRDVIGDMANIRRNLGVCPQHDILYPDLTVKEHLRMYAVLKGVRGSCLQEAISVRISCFWLTFVRREVGNGTHLSVSIARGVKLVYLSCKHSASNRIDCAGGCHCYVKTFWL